MMKPDRERLKELKRIVENEFEVFNEKIQHFCITPIGRDLLALIDAALAEPDADVAEAIDIIEKNWPPENYTMLREALTIAIEIMRQYQKPTGETSDGYHTFDELYHHRAVLFSALCYAYKDKAWRAKKHHDGTMFGDDWFICGVETPQGQYTYHYHISECWDLFDFCKTLDNAPEWDGHQPKDVDRLLSLRQMRSAPCDRPEIICLCGSTRFYETFRKANFDLTLQGKIVLSIGCDTKSDDGLRLTAEDKKRLDELHKRKIDLADRVLVLNVGGYIGNSTRSEIKYAITHKKPIDYLESSYCTLNKVIEDAE